MRAIILAFAVTLALAAPVAFAADNSLGENLSITIDRISDPPDLAVQLIMSYGLGWVGGAILLVVAFGIYSMIVGDDSNRKDAAFTEQMKRDYAHGSSVSMLAAQYRLEPAKIEELMSFDAKTAPKPPEQDRPTIIPFDVDWDQAEYWAATCEPDAVDFIWHGHRLRKTQDGRLKAIVRPIASMTPAQRLRQRRRAA